VYDGLQLISQRPTLWDHRHRGPTPLNHVVRFDTKGMRLPQAIGTVPYAATG